jgi:hypothetical protein
LLEYRQPWGDNDPNLDKNGWTFVRLKGTPEEIGFQNGYLLAPEIDDLLKVTSRSRDARRQERLAVLSRGGAHHDVAAHRARNIARSYKALPMAPMPRA